MTPDPLGFAEIKPGQIFTACYAQNKDGVTGMTGTFWNLPSKDLYDT